MSALLVLVILAAAAYYGKKKYDVLEARVNKLEEYNGINAQPEPIEPVAQ
jgi:hypothetical protein